MSKLVPAVQDLSLCIRCRYRQTVSLRNRPTPARSRRFTSKPRSNQVQARQPGPLPDAYQIEGQDVIRYFAPKRKAPQPRIEEIGAEALGIPARAIVLNPAMGDLNNGRLHPEFADGNQKNSIPLIPNQIIEEIQNRRGNVSADDVVAIMEDIRLSTGMLSGIVPDALFDDLASKISSGLTYDQLFPYVNRLSRTLPMEQLNISRIYFSTLYARSAWTAGSTHLTETRAPQIGERGTPRGIAAIRKPALVDKVLRQLWNIRPRRDEALIGEMDIRVQPIHLKLLLNHRRDIIKKFSESYGVKIEVSHQESIIRVSSDFDACYDILRLFIYVFENIQCSQIEASGLFSRSDRDKEIILACSEVEKLTSTVLKTAKHKLDVYYLGPGTTDLDDARRLIDGIKSDKAKDNKLAVCIRNSDSIVPSPIDVGISLPLKHRMIQWSRWCTPDTSRDHSSLPSDRLVHEIQSFLPGYGNYEVPESIARYWTPKGVHKIKAFLGQVVFPTLEAQTVKEPHHDISAYEHKNPRREFVHSVPGMMRFLAALENTDDTHEMLHIHLSPSSSESTKSLNLPNLELGVKLDQSEKLVTLHIARLVANEAGLDILLPNNTVDLRLSTKTVLHANALDPALEDFIQSSNLNVWGPDRLTTPPTLKLAIPPSTIRSSSTLDLSQPLTVDYTFTGLEHRSGMRIPFGRINLDYTTVEAGRAGGRREEVSLGLGDGQSGTSTSLVKREKQARLLWNVVTRLIAEIENPSPRGVFIREYKF